MSRLWAAAGVAMLAMCSAGAVAANDALCPPDSLTLCGSKLRPSPARFGYAEDPDYRTSLVPSLSVIDETADTRLRHRFGLQRASRDAGLRLARLPLSDTWSIDLAASPGRVDSGRIRFEPVQPSAMSSLRPGYEPERALWSVSLSASRYVGALGLAGRIGYLDVRERSVMGGFDSGASLPGDRSGFLRQAYLGFDASYGIAQNWQLHGSAIYRRDTDARFAAGPAGGFGGMHVADRDEKEWAIGVRYYGWRNFALNVEFLKTSGRDFLPAESLTFTGRIGF